MLQDFYCRLKHIVVDVVLVYVSMDLRSKFHFFFFFFFGLQSMDAVSHVQRK